MRRRHRGQSLTEFAFVVPMLLVLVFVLIDFSRMLFTHISITNGARELARVVAITGPWVSNHAPSTTNTVNAFNNLTVFAGPTTPMNNFSLSPTSGTISCSSITSAGCPAAAPKIYEAPSPTFVESFALLISNALSNNSLASVAIHPLS